MSGAPTEGPFLDVSVGVDSCAVRADGTLACWGMNLTRILDEVPAGAFVSVAVGSGFACALDAAGAPTCWGPFDGRGGTLAPRLSRIAVGWHLVCGLDVDGALTCDGSFNDCRQDHTPLDGVYAEVIAPTGHGCVTDLAGVVVCFNARWSDEDYELPGSGFHHLTAGQGHTCALDPAGEVACVGPSGVEEALAGMPPGPWADLTAGGHTLCGIRADRTAACWGAVGYGQDAVPTD